MSQDAIQEFTTTPIGEPPERRGTTTHQLSALHRIMHQSQRFKCGELTFVQLKADIQSTLDWLNLEGHEPRSSWDGLYHFIRNL